jgi:hypothetical protein
MKSTSIALVLAAALGAILTSAWMPASAEDAMQRLKDFDETMRAVQRLHLQQNAKCKMEVSQYVDEHPLPDGTPPEVAARRWLDRIHDCMEAAGWPVINHTSAREQSQDWYRRMREIWVASGKSQSDLDWFDQEVDRSIPSE